MTATEDILLLAKPITDEEHYEKALLLIRKLRGAKKDSYEEKVRKVLLNFIKAYEDDQYPFGQENFNQWLDSLNETVVNAKLKEIELAELKVSLEEEFKKRRSKIIKDTLRERSMKQEDLSKLLSVDKSFVSNILRGRKELSVQIISKIHHCLNVSYDDLIPPPFALGGIDRTSDKKRPVKKKGINY